MSQQTSANWLVISYLGLRKVVGIIGIALPFVLAFGKIIFEGPGIEPSVSNYYYTGMRDVFVGALCAIAGFLLSIEATSEPMILPVTWQASARLEQHFSRRHPMSMSLRSTRGKASCIFPSGRLLPHSRLLLFSMFRKTDPTKPPTRRGS